MSVSSTARWQPVLREMDAEEERKVDEVKRESEREAVERDEMELVTATECGGRHAA